MLMSVSATPAPEVRRHIPGEPGIWVLIGGDVLAFSLFFVTFFVYRLDDPALFAASQPLLSQNFGMLNTLIMLTSSWLVATSVQAARDNRMQRAQLGLVLAVLCGLAFFVIKMFEYTAKVKADITVNTNDFFMLYFTFTGVHLLHVMVGTGVLIFLIFNLRSGSNSAAKVRNLESGGSFWHLVDLLWIVLFALFYLIR